MKPTHLIFLLLFIPCLVFGQGQNILFQTHLNVKNGKPMANVGISVDEIGNCLTFDNGLCNFKNLKKSIGMQVSISASLQDHAVVNLIKLKAYTLTNRKIDTIKVILAKKHEREKYAIQYFEEETGIILTRKFEQQIAAKNKIIDELVKKYATTKEDDKVEKKALRDKLDLANVELDKIRQEKSKQQDIAEQIARTLAMIEEDNLQSFLPHAYHYFELGDFLKADSVLNGKQILNDIREAKLEIELGKLKIERGTRKLNNAIAECLFKAQINERIYDFREAELWYEKAYQADSMRAETLYYFANFLHAQNRPKRPADLYERALEIYEDSTQNNPTQYSFFIAMTLNNLGDFYKNNQEKVKSQVALERASIILEDLVQNNPQYLPVLSTLLTNLGNFYRDNQERIKAQNAYERALKISEYLAQNDPTQYLSVLAYTLSSLGIFYKDNQEKIKAQNAYERALKISEYLAQNDPTQYFNVATTLLNLGILYNNNQEKIKAQNAYEKALKISEDLVQKNPNRYLPFVATIWNNLGKFYKDFPEKVKAQHAYESALKIREELAQNNPAQYLPYVAMTQVNFAVFHLQNSNLIQGEELLIRGLSNYQSLAQQFDNFQFWQKSLQIVDSLSNIIAKDSMLSHKLNMQQAIVNFYEGYPQTTQATLLINYDIIIWDALRCRQYSKAEQYARKALAKDAMEYLIYSSLALALLLQNRWEEAKSIYQEKQNLIGNNEKPLKEAFLSDLIDLEKVGINHPNFEKVRALLK